MEDTQDVRDVIAAALEGRGLTQTDLARGLGTSQAQVSRLLSGHRTMSVNVMFRMLDWLDVPVGVLTRERS